MTPRPPAARVAAARGPPGKLSIPLVRRIERRLERLAGTTDEVVPFVDGAHERHDRATLRVRAPSLRCAPERVHLVRLGRAVPALPRTSLRAQGAVFELKADALCFDPGEAKPLRRSRPGRMAADEGAQLQAYSGGWIAALQAAPLT